MIILTQLLVIVILLLTTANLTISLLILLKFLSSLDKAKIAKDRMFPFVSWMEK